jgi:hypothetical protein
MSVFAAPLGSLVGKPADAAQEIHNPERREGNAGENADKNQHYENRLLPRFEWLGWGGQGNLQKLAGWTRKSARRLSGGLEQRLTPAALATSEELERPAPRHRHGDVLESEAFDFGDGFAGGTGHGAVQIGLAHRILTLVETGIAGQRSRRG